ncbi:two-component sensor histidine kinase [Prodigiosinella confusarubida]|uniref:histidine kinase n=1 Tax=Serratia sp. (strain ATCC 39006) TaxID=104623 RepID=A0A2I5TPD4_SERS3|nr:ATP-binding protein [Serratia sp. ATCC 39006]AUH02084.1 two-component sensor histidine kinase [Serratia sp. ATCC 39006]AUH06405.1 two-component sensor histidine kinase [Serratia sp. ATCC 39006]
MKVWIRRLHLWFMKSLRRRLLLWLLPATFFAGVLASIGTYWGASSELNDLLNDQMRYIAEHTSISGDAQVAFLSKVKHKKKVDEDKVLLQVWSQDKMVFSTAPSLTPPAPKGEGLQNIVFLGQTWHTFVERRGNQVIRVAQAQNARWEALAGLSIHLFWPVLSLLPLLALFLWFGISYGLKPLGKIGEELGRRDVNSLTPIVPESLPEEVEPLVYRINDLLQRLDQAFTMQKNFIADAAHELRTPAMAIGIQNQLAQQAGNEQERQLALAELQNGVERFSHLVQQLLALARLEPDALASQCSVDLLSLCRTVIIENLLSSEIKAIDLGLITDEKITVTGDPEALHILLSNLVSNALRYTPQHGQVDLAVYQDEGGVVLSVCDTGPGIPKNERALVLERFYRAHNQNIAGSGLGLSIVKRIAECHRASVSLGSGAGEQGLCVQIRFPFQ